MSRPIKCRRVGYFPKITYFKPAGKPLKAIEEICISMEEVEALRLKDLENLEQEQGADRMNISRPTFQRILTSARQKISEALLNGKAIRIEGGNYEMTPCQFKCDRGHEWEVSFEIATSRPPEICPVCEVAAISCFHQAGQDCGKAGHVRCCQLRCNSK